MDSPSLEGQKTCTKCGRTKSACEFYPKDRKQPNGQVKSGFESYCKRCKKKKRKTPTKKKSSTQQQTLQDSQFKNDRRDSRPHQFTFIINPVEGDAYFTALDNLLGVLCDADVINEN